MDYRVKKPKSRVEAYVVLLRRIVVPLALLGLPIYLFVRLAGGSGEKLDQLPDLFDRIQRPIICEVPDGGLRYVDYFRGPADTDHKFAVVDVRLAARIKIGFPVVPRSFRMVDDHNVRHYPLARSPFFIQYGNHIQLDQGDVLEGQLLFEIPRDRVATNLLFDRYEP